MIAWTPELHGQSRLLVDQPLGFRNGEPDERRREAPRCQIQRFKNGNSFVGRQAVGILPLPADQPLPPTALALDAHPFEPPGKDGFAANVPQAG